MYQYEDFTTDNPAYLDAVASHLATICSDLSAPAARISPSLISNVLEAASAIRCLKLKDVFEADEILEEVSTEINSEFAERIFNVLKDDEVAMPPGPELIATILDCEDAIADDYMLDYLLSCPCDESLDPEYRARNLHMRGDAKRIKGELTEALKDFDMACTLMPDVPQYYVTKAKLYTELGMKTKAQDEAIKAFNAMLKTDDSYFAADIAELLAGDYPSEALRAVELFISAVSSDINSINMYKVLLVDSHAMLFDDIVTNLLKCEKIAKDLTYGDSEILENAKSILDKIILLKVRLGIQ